jgi:hypothetical protein
MHSLYRHYSAINQGLITTLNENRNPHQPLLPEFENRLCINETAEIITPCENCSIKKYFGALKTDELYPHFFILGADPLDHHLPSNSNELCVGVPKAATTSLHSLLVSHDEICDTKVCDVTFIEHFISNL